MKWLKNKIRWLKNKIEWLSNITAKINAVVFLLKILKITIIIFLGYSIWSLYKLNNIKYILNQFETLSNNWPLAAVIIILILKAPISSFLYRVKSITKDGVDTHPLQKTNKKEGGLSKDEISTEKTSKTTSNTLPEFPILVHRELIRKVEKNIKEQLNETKYNSTDILTRELASSQAALDFERVYQNIYGSQLNALEFLSKYEEVERNVLSSFYTTAAQTTPDMYKNTTFDSWLGYLTNWELLKVEKDKLKITIEGKSFLAYITTQAYSKNKAF